MVFQNDKDHVISLLFVEYYKESLAQPVVSPLLETFSDPWVITAFRNQNVPWYEYIDSVGGGLRESEQYSWTVESQLGECSMLGNLPNTQIVGFATTQKEEVDDQLQSI